MKQEDASDFIEGKDWGPSYCNLGNFIFFSKFCNQSCSTKTRSQASGINIQTSIKTSTFTFFGPVPPLGVGVEYISASSSSKQGCHRLGPTSSLFVSICHDLYFVCKAASVRSDLLQALYKLVIISNCEVSSVQLDLLQFLIQVTLRFLSTFVRLHQSGSISYKFCYKLVIG